MATKKTKAAKSAPKAAAKRVASKAPKSARPKASKAAPRKVAREAKAAKAPLLPQVLRADGEDNAFLRDFKAKWLTRPDFTSATSLQSQLQGALMLLALKRDAEAEELVDNLLRHVDARQLSGEAWEATWGAFQLSAWLKTARGLDVRELLARAQQGPRVSAHRDREWLSNEAAGEIKDALDRKRLAYLVEPIGGVLRWLNDAGARDKARAIWSQALDAVRALMK